MKINITVEKLDSGFIVTENGKTKAMSNFVNVEDYVKAAFMNLIKGTTHMTITADVEYCLPPKSV